jgi:hypothetical protein
MAGSNNGCETSAARRTAAVRVQARIAQRFAVFLGQRLQAKAPVVVREKHVLPIVPAVNDMTPTTRDSDARNTPHARQITKREGLPRKPVTVPNGAD